MFLLPHTKRLFADVEREEQEQPFLAERGEVERPESSGDVLLLKLRQKAKLAQYRRMIAQMGVDPQLARSIAIGQNHYDDQEDGR